MRNQVLKTKPLSRPDQDTNQNLSKRKIVDYHLVTNEKTNQDGMMNQKKHDQMKMIVMNIIRIKQKTMKRIKKMISYHE